MSNAFPDVVQKSIKPASFEWFQADPKTGVRDAQSLAERVHQWHVSWGPPDHSISKRSEKHGKKRNCAFRKAWSPGKSLPLFSVYCETWLAWHLDSWGSFRSHQNSCLLKQVQASEVKRANATSRLAESCIPAISHNPVNLVNPHPKSKGRLVESDLKQRWLHGRPPYHLNVSVGCEVKIWMMTLHLRQHADLDLGELADVLKWWTEYKVDSNG